MFFGELGCDSLGESFPVEGFAADKVVEGFAVDALVFDWPRGDGFEERDLPASGVVFDVFLKIDDQLATIRFGVEAVGVIGCGR